MANLPPGRRRRKRRTRTKTWLRRAAATLALAALLIPSDLGLPIRKLIAAAAELPDALSLLALRSPHGRAGGNLHTSKPRRMPQVAMDGPSRTNSGPFVPEERVLAEVRTRSPALPGLDTGAPDTGFAPDEAPGLDSAPADFTPFVGPPLGGGSGGFEPPIFSISDGIPPVPPSRPDVPLPPIPPAPPAPPKPPPVPMVPEPATWMTMMLGFFALGTALRRRSGVMRRA